MQVLLDAQEGRHTEDGEKSSRIFSENEALRGLLEVRDRREETLLVKLEEKDRVIQSLKEVVERGGGKGGERRGEGGMGRVERVIKEGERRGEISKKFAGVLGGILKEVRGEMASLKKEVFVLFYFFVFVF